MEDRRKLSDISVDEFVCIASGTNHGLLSEWFKDIAEQVSSDLSSKLDEKIDLKIDSKIETKLISVGIDVKEPKKEQEKQSFVKNLMVDKNFIKHSLITQVITGVSGVGVGAFFLNIFDVSVGG